MAILTPSFVTDLDAPLLRLGRRDVWTARDAFTGTLVLGGVGSGKTSGSGKYLATTMLSSGWGGLVLCAKPDEADRWRRYARDCGREKSLIVFDGSGRWKFNFLKYAMAMEMAAGGVGNVAAVLTTVLQAASGNTAPPGAGSGDQFWQKAAKEAITHALAILWAAFGTVTLEDMMRLLQSRPAQPKAITAEWKKASYMAAALATAYERPMHAMPEADFWGSYRYLTEVLPNPDPRTTGNLIQTLSADLFPLMMGPMRELFGSGLNVCPEMTHEGAVIVMDLPVRGWAEAGVLGQGIMKYLWQRAAERRRVDKHTRPVFLFVDEAQLLLSPYDAEFQSTARSARIATVYLSQNLPAFYERVGGRNPQDVADALLGHFQTKIFHSNTCHRTNQWASDGIGKRLQMRRTWGENVGGGTSWGTQGGWSSQSSSGPGGGSNGGGNTGGWSDGGNISEGRNAGVNEVIDYDVQPSRFTGLRPGGPENAGIVDGIMVKGGTPWRGSGRNWLPIEFQQS
ncbi:type IV secretory system conjugative DNA transfer family protein (plasmid) [Skermanella rosea]|uniref:type IV secretory system conjugative DNA transfer family protein n=1 Tax=Skermanella rosea TaxID=1817965 RepID=UPI0019341D27|nr:type IV secretory system conjugative DNA transfer family protein [Skermanella rosea]UEM08040.1 type IV secretory system conjugative DNA transfer family protein [Skermanella rosea]